MLGCKYEKIEIVNHLLRAGVDVNKIDDFEGLIMEKDSQNISQGFIPNLFRYTKFFNDVKFRFICFKFFPANCDKIFQVRYCIREIAFVEYQVVIYFFCKNI